MLKILAIFIPHIHELNNVIIFYCRIQNNIKNLRTNLRFFILYTIKRSVASKEGSQNSITEKIIRITTLDLYGKSRIHVVLIDDMHRLISIVYKYRLYTRLRIHVFQKNSKILIRNMKIVNNGNPYVYIR